MKKRKLLYLLLLPLFLGMWSSSAKASHAVGADMTYTCKGGGCLRTFFYTIYVNCATAAGNPTNPGNPTFSCGNTQVGVLATGPWTIVSDVEITLLCPGQQSQCTNSNSTVPGIREVVSRRTYDFCKGEVMCLSYTMRWSLCCRNSGITSLSPQSQTMGGRLTMPFSMVNCNSSPVFSSDPVVRICMGQANTFTQGATDPDGNTLQYSMVACSKNGSSDVTYAGGFSASSPLGSGWNVTLDPNTGNLSFVPNPGNATLTGVICIRVTELDGNGIVIGSTVRDIQVSVVACNNNLPVLSGPYIYNACVGKQFCFNTTASDADLNNQITVSVLSNTIGATITTTNGQGGGAQVCFTPTAPGSYSVVLQVMDDNCPIPGLQQYTFTFVVTNCDPCDAANINMSWTHTESLLSTTITNTSTAATGLGPVFTTFIWGDGSPNTTYSGNYALPVTHTYAASGWYTVCVVLEVYIGNLCCHDTLCRTIYISDDPCDFFQASFTATQSTPCAINFTNTSTPGASNLYWDFGDGSPVGTGNNVSHTYASGTYTVTLTVMWHPTNDPNLCCTSTFSQTYTIFCGHTPGGGEVKRVTHASVGYLAESEQAQVTLGAEADDVRDATVELYDLSGKLLQRAELGAGSRQGRLHLNGYANGLYLVRISAGTHVETIKFLKY
jgi:PKD domain